MRATTLKASPTRGKSDHNDWFRCPRCGFINQWSKTATPTMANVGIYDVQQESPDPGISPGALTDTHCYCDEPRMLGCTVKYGDDGVSGIAVYYTPRYYQANSGCRFCGQVWLDR